MKPSLLILFSLFAFSFSNAQTSNNSDTSRLEKKADSRKPETQFRKKKNVSNKAYVMRSTSYVNDVVRLQEGYTALDGGRYAIKDYLVKGRVNLICLTYGVSLGATYVNRGESSKRYYLHREGDNTPCREVFLTKNTDPASKILLGESQTYNGMLNTRKSSGGMAEISKAILSEMMADDAEVAEQIAKIEKVTARKLKELVKLYNK